MRLRLSIVAGALAVLAAAWMLRPKAKETPSVKRPRPKPVLETRGGVERLEAPAPAGDAQEEPAVEEPKAFDAMALMGEPASSLGEIRRKFLDSSNAEERLEALHVLLAQHRRFGAALEVDREALQFLKDVLRDPKLGELHGGAIGALGRWESPEAIDAIGAILANPPSPRAYAQAAETLAELRHPAAAAEALEFFRGAKGAEACLAGANLLLRLASASPAAAAALRSEVRPALERELASADGWTRKALTRTLNEIR